MGAMDVSLWELRSTWGSRSVQFSAQISSLTPLSTSILIFPRLKAMLRVVHHIPVPDDGIYGEEVLGALQEAV